MTKEEQSKDQAAFNFGTLDEAIQRLRVAFEAHYEDRRGMTAVMATDATHSDIINSVAAYLEDIL